jgi:phosphoribosylglycinamide formyltransferase-1
MRIAVLLSGRGSNLKALIDACGAASFPAEIVLAISNVPDAPGLQHAKDAGIATLTIDHRKFPNRDAFDSALDVALNDCAADLVCLAGFMRILTTDFVERWRDRMLNIHPALLPAFKGLDAQQQALDAGVKLAGCSVHFVRPGMDEGPIIAQAAVPVLSNDTAETLSARILIQEHVLYPLAIKLITDGQIRIENEIAIIDRGGDAQGTLISPNAH